MKLTQIWSKWTWDFVTVTLVMLVQFSDSSFIWSHTTISFWRQISNHKTNKYLSCTNNSSSSHISNNCWHSHHKLIQLAAKSELKFKLQPSESDEIRDKKQQNNRQHNFHSPSESIPWLGWETSNRFNQKHEYNTMILNRPSWTIWYDFVHQMHQLIPKRNDQAGRTLPTFIPCNIKWSPANTNSFKIHKN